MNKRNILKITGLIAGMMATLMLFIIPFVFIALDINIDKYSTYYFITFLTLVAIGNISLKKSESNTLEDIRDEKIDQIFR